MSALHRQFRYEQRKGPGFLQHVASGYSLAQKQMAPVRTPRARPARKNYLPVSRRPNVFMDSKPVYRRKSMSSSSSRSTSKSGTSRGVAGGALNFQKKANGKMSKPKSNSADVKGCHIMSEFRSSGSDVNVMNVGHATLPQLQVMQALAGSLVRALANQLRAPFVGWYESTELEVGSFVYIQTAPINGSAGTTTLVRTIVPLDVWQTLQSIITTILQTTDSQTEFVRLYHLSSTGTTRTNIRLSDAKIHIVAKSTLKMQNISTPSAADNEADDVTCIPLEGISYAGSGMGTTKVRPSGSIVADAAMIANPANGIIQRAGSTAAVINEPYPAKAFYQVKKTGKCALSPGEIQRSVLVSSYSMNFNKFWSNVATANLSFATKQVGKFRFFAFEKVINVDAARLVNVALENQIDISATLSHQFTNFCEPLITV